MSDVYVECLVPAKASGLVKVLRVVLLLLTVLFFFTMLLFPAAILLAIACGVGFYFANLNSKVEYEYLYLDRELTVDKILSQTKRKRVAVYSIDRMEIFAPVNSWHLDSFKNRNVKVVDYSVGQELQPDLRYVMYYEGGVKLILSPSEPLIKAVKNVAPRKVFTD
ncbi:MAG: hypothetical protein NC092_10450 [Butyrivibrio sp.]|nr:hypothetical protein [Muribaculum sp.]MCM1553099.1 hypothetical protein [Butyrivibrio sp.]